MGWDGKIMTEPIGWGDISQALHESSLTMGDMVTNGIIHKWSKFKPFIHAAPNFPNLASRLTALRSANCGFTIPTASSLAEAMNKSIIGNDWIYNKPTEGAPNNYFRSQDMIGYNNYQNPPFNYTVNPNGGICFLDGSPRVIKVPESQTLPSGAAYDYEDFPNTLGASGMKPWLLVRTFGSTGTPEHWEITENMNYPYGAMATKKECCVIICKESDFKAASPKFYLLPHTYCIVQGTGQVGITTSGGTNTESVLFTDRISIRPIIRAVGSTRTLANCKICFRFHENYRAISEYAELYECNALPNANEQFASAPGGYISGGEFILGTVTCDTTNGYVAVPAGLSSVSLRLPLSVDIRNDGRLFFYFTFGGDPYCVPITWRDGANN